MVTNALDYNRTFNNALDDILQKKNNALDDAKNLRKFLLN